MKEHASKLKLISLLADGQFHSGEALGEALGISRAAISKQVKVLQSWGLDIYRIQGRGYCLAKSITLLDKGDILSHCICSNLDVIPVIDSTNQYLLDRVGQLPSEPFVLLNTNKQVGDGVVVSGYLLLVVTYICRCIGV